MPKSPTKLTIYQLIEAGQLARTALLRPLAALGLETGDDALIFALDRDTSVSDARICELTGLQPTQLLPRLERLIRLDIITRVDAVETGNAGSRLTEKGAQIRKQLLAQWQEMDKALIGELTPKRRKNIRRILGRFAELLSF